MQDGKFVSCIVIWDILFYNNCQQSLSAWRSFGFKEANQEKRENP